MSTLYVVATPIGNLKDLSFRALEVLQQVQMIACEDTRTSSVLLKHYGIETATLSYHKFNERERASELIAKMLETDYDVALISDAGTPCISDPGWALVEEARRQGVEVTPVPGASALTAALSIAGLPFQRMTFLGFFPRKDAEQQTVLQCIDAAESDVYVFYESPKRVIATLQAIDRGNAATNLVVIKDLTKKFERVFCGTASAIIEQLQAYDYYENGEYVVLVEAKKRQKAEETLLPEAVLVHAMAKYGIGAKEAITRLVQESKQYKKNDLYEASLRLKEMFAPKKGK